MSEYKSIKGKTVQYLGTDPSETSTEGQVWYNSTAGAFKSVIVSEAWSSGAPINFNRAYIAGFGTTTAALGAGGYNSPLTFETATEEYNGSGWATGGALNTGRYGLRGTGSQTAGLVFMGVTPGPPGRTAATEEYDGTSWTNGGNLSEARYQGAAAGTQTAGLVFGGGPATASPPVSTATEEYDGSSWTNGGTLNTAVRDNASASAAPQTAAISFGGIIASGPPNFTAQSEEYDGSTWTVVNSMNLARSVLGGSGIQTSALGYGGAGAPSNSVAKTEVYDGTNWSTSPADLATGRRYLAGAGSNSSAAVAFQGKSGSTNTVLTEEYNKSINVITAAAWASATAMPRNHGEHIGGSGSASDGLAFGGEGPTNYNYTEEWNGSSWTAGGNWPASDESIMGCGTSGPTTIGFGGIGNVPGSPPVNRQTTSATYDGSSWTTTNSLPVAKRAGQGFGTNTAAVAAGGDTSPTDPQTSVEEWDGTNWTAVTAMPEGKGNMGGGTGTQTAGLVFGGYNPSPAGTSNTTLEYDGTSWTAGGNMNVGRNQVNGWGGPAGQTASMCGGGNDGAVSLLTEAYDGTSWSTKPNLATARQGSANGIGTSQTTGIQAGGSTGSYVTTVEEFTGETSALNVKTLTTS